MSNFIVIAFSKPKCPFCERQREHLSKKFGNIFSDYDISQVDSKSMMDKYKVKVAPTVILAKPDGEEVYRKLGVMNSDEIEAFAEMLF